MLGKRLGSAMVGMVIILGSLYLGDIYFAIVVGVVITLGIWEFCSLMKLKGIEINPYAIAAVSLTNLLYIMYFKNINAIVPLGLLLLFFTWGKEIIYNEPVGIGQKISTTLLCYFYVGVLFSYLQLLWQLQPGSGAPGGMGLLVFCFFITWANDTGAYFAGMFHGKHPLCPHISPKKTVEGAFGGLLLGLAIACAFSLFKLMSYQHAITIGLLSSIAAQIGDLYESSLKREVQVKDTSDVLPGHGGVLDRFDSLLWVTPLIYYYFLLIA